MHSGDGWLTRVKPPRAVLTATAARSLAVAAVQFGNGAIELTSRANLQVRGLALDGVARFAQAIVAAGLADSDVATERRRRVIHPPLADADFRLATEIEETLAKDPPLASLPAKFCVAVDDGGALALDQTGADLTVIGTGPKVLIVPAGSSQAVPVMAVNATDAVRRIAHSFCTLTRLASPPPRRMRTLIDMIGAEKLFAVAGLEPSVVASSRVGVEAIGWLPTPNGGVDKGESASTGVIGLGLPRGTMDAATVVSLADLAEEYGNGEIRLTPWRVVLLPGVAARHRDAVEAAALALGLIADSADHRRAIVTCTGQPGCAAASVDVRSDAAMLVHLQLPGPVHVSGCAKGCAHHAAAPITLVGQDGHYNFIRDGDTQATPLLRGLTMRQVIQTLGERR